MGGQIEVKHCNLIQIVHKLLAYIKREQTVWAIRVKRPSKSIGQKLSPAWKLATQIICRFTLQADKKGNVNGAPNKKQWHCGSDKIISCGVLDWHLSQWFQHFYCFKIVLQFITDTYSAVAKIKAHKTQDVVDFLPILSNTLLHAIGIPFKLWGNMTFFYGNLH